MKRINVLIFLFLYFYNYCLIAQDNDGWILSKYPKFESKAWKLDGKITYFVDSAMDISQRNKIIEKTKEYIADNLRFINESNYDDSLYVITVHDRGEMKEYTGRTIGGLTYIKDEVISVNVIYIIYKEGRSPLKHELMHLVCYNKWGETCGAMLSWLAEGLAMLADPDLDNCEDRTFEEKYAFFLQTNKLLSTEDLMSSLGEYEMPQVKIAYAQAAYIVEYLLKHYGMGKIKQLWTSSIGDFEIIFSLTFEKMIQQINNELNEKYPNPIDFDWVKFNQRHF